MESVLLQVMLIVTIVGLSVALAVVSFQNGVHKGEWRMRRRMIEEKGIYDQQASG